MTETEATICAVCEQLLDIDNVTPEDDFFSLGGDSLQATRILLELERRFDLAIPPDVIEVDSNLRQLASWIDARVKR